VVQRARVGEESLDVEGALQSMCIAGQLTQGIKFARNRIVIPCGLRAEEDLEPNRNGGCHEVVIEDATPLGRNLWMSAPVPRACVG